MNSPTDVGLRAGGFSPFRGHVLDAAILRKHLQNGAMWLKIWKGPPKFPPKKGNKSLQTFKWEDVGSIFGKTKWQEAKNRR